MVRLRSIFGLLLPSVCARLPLCSQGLQTVSCAGSCFPYEEFCAWLAYGNGRIYVQHFQVHLQRLSVISCMRGSVRLRIHPIRYYWRCQTRRPGLLVWRGQMMTCVCDKRTWCADSNLPQADSMFFHRRELCFTLDGDIFVRYQSFKVRARWPPALPPHASTPQSSSAQPSSGQTSSAGQGGAPEGHGKQGASKDRHWAGVQCGSPTAEGLHW